GNRCHCSVQSLTKASAMLNRPFGRGSRGLIFLPREQEEQRYPGADGAVGDIESRKANFAAAPTCDVKVDEIHHVAVSEAVHQITSNAAENQPERKLAEQRVRIKVVPGKKQHQQRHQRENGQQLIAAGELIEQAPRRAGVAPMAELEETVDDHLFLRVTEITQHGKLRKLVD